MKTLLIPAIIVASLLGPSAAWAKQSEGDAAVKAAKAAGCIAPRENDTAVVFETISICYGTYAGEIRVAHVYTGFESGHQSAQTDLPPSSTQGVKLRADVTFWCDGKITDVICSR